MIEFGKTLREAREAAGLTVAQLADKTHMPPSRIEQLESEDFSKIPAAIYGRGFVRLYCEAVGLDPRPLSAEFTDIFNGRREPEIRERTPAVPSPEPSAAPSPVPAASAGRDASSASAGRDASSASVGRNVPGAPQEPEPNEPVEGDLFAEPARASAAAPTAAPSLSRYAAPVRETARRSLPPFVWRFAVLGAVAVVVLWLAFLGVRALYRATGGTPPTDVEEAAPQSEVAAPAAPATPTSPAAPRTQQKIPELYID